MTNDKATLFADAAATREAREPRWGLWAFCVIAVFGALRLWIAGSGQLDLAQDEAQYWDWSRRAFELSYYSKGPLITWLIAAGTALFGDTELGVRLFAVVNNLAVQVLLYGWLGVLLQRPRLALITLCIANTAPLFIVSGVLMTTDSPLLLFWTAALFCLSAVTEQRSQTEIHQRFPWPFWGLGAAVCFGILSKYSMLLFAALALVYALILRRRGMLDSRRFYGLLAALALGVALGSLPILLWNVGNDFVAFRHVAGLAAKGGEFTLRYFVEYLGAQVGLLLPWWLGVMLYHGWRLRTPLTTSGGAEYRFYLLLSLGFWPIWLFFLLWSLVSRVYPNWAAMCYATGIVIAALGVERLWDTARRKQRGCRKALLYLCMALSVVVCLGIHGQKLLTDLVPLPEKFNPTVRLKGWSELGKELDRARRAMPDPEEVFFFSDAYDVTAALAFYLPGRPVVYCVDFGRRANQYDLWPGPNGAGRGANAGQDDADAVQGGRSTRDAIFVTRKPMKSAPRRLTDMFRDASARPVAFQAVHQGQKGRSFGYMPLYGFTGVWPAPAWKRF